MYLIGIEIAYCRREIFISQQQHMANLVKYACKLGCMPIEILIDFNYKLGGALEDTTIEKSSH